MNQSFLPALLYVEDEDEMAQIVTEVLSETYAVTHVQTAEEALSLALSGRYAVMLIDRRLPGMSGTELVARVRAAQITTPILMLTALGTIDDRVTGLDIGANDYLVKPFDFAELQARLRALIRGYAASGKTRHLGSWVYLPDMNALISPYENRISLTHRENKLLELLSSSPQRIFSREEILKEVFPGKESVGTVESYVSYIRGKTDPDMIETVRGRGYRVGEPS